MTEQIMEFVRNVLIILIQMKCKISKTIKHLDALYYK